MSDNLDYVTYIHLHTLNYLKLSPPYPRENKPSFGRFPQLA